MNKKKKIKNKWTCTNLIVFFFWQKKFKPILCVKKYHLWKKKKLGQREVTNKRSEIVIPWKRENKVINNVNQTTLKRMTRITWGFRLFRHSNKVKSIKKNQDLSKIKSLNIQFHQGYICSLSFFFQFSHRVLFFFPHVRSNDQHAFEKFHFHWTTYSDINYSMAVIMTPYALITTFLSFSFLFLSL